MLVSSLQPPSSTIREYIGTGKRKQIFSSIYRYT